MPLTNEEAEALIAEIKNKVFCGADFPEKNNCVPKVEKIIKHFAQKPPYKMEFNGAIYQELILSVHDKYTFAVLTAIDPQMQVNIVLDKARLKELSSNCTKMLEHLNEL